MASPRAQVIAWTDCRGRNGWDAPQDIPADMAAEALNVHFYNGGLCEKRGGSTSTGTLTGATGPVNAMFSWTPGQVATARELFLVDNDSPINLLRMAGGSTTADITLTDAITVDAAKARQINAASLNGKSFIAYDSAVNRLHVFDPGLSTTSCRRAGMGTSAAATVANTGSGSYAATLRYYKVCYTEVRSSVVVRRGELSAAVSFTPSGSGTHARITKPAAISEGETHWEVYASADNLLYYGPIASTVVGTTTVDDNGVVADYDTNWDLEPTAGVNTVFPSVKFLYSNGVRLFGLGVWETAAGDSHTPQPGTVYLTPALDSSSIHDEERCENTTSAIGRVILGRNAGGIDTGISGLGNTVYAFQDSAIFGLVPTENAKVPYRRVQISNSIGAVSHHSIVQSEDELGRPCLYFLDSRQGPYRLGYDGLKYVGKDVKDLWEGRDPETSSPCHGVYYRAKRQVWWWFPSGTGGSSTPNRMLVLDVPEQRQDQYGDLRGGWSTWTGTQATALCSAMMATTLGATMSLDERPYACLTAGTVLLKGDSGATDDNTTNFQAYLTSGAITVEPMPTHKALIKSHLMAKAATGVTITQTYIRNFGDETNRADTVLLTAAGSETRVLRRFEAGELQDAFLFQVQLGDASASDAVWTLDRWYGEVEGNEER